jgi:hypothetical protein
VSEDLDADLYADLYGDEDPQTVTDSKSEKTTVETKPVPTISSKPGSNTKDGKPSELSTLTSDPRQGKPPSATTPTSSVVPAPLAPTALANNSTTTSGSTPVPVQSTPQPLHASQPIAVAPLTQTAPPTSYGNRAYQTGAPIPTGHQYEHRGVRPSEMKEEG